MPCPTCSKEKKLKKNMKFPKEYDVKIDLSKGINWEVMKTWITPRVTELLGTDDEVLVNYVCEQFENKKVSTPHPTPAAFSNILCQSHLHALTLVAACTTTLADKICPSDFYAVTC